MKDNCPDIRGYNTFKQRHFYITGNTFQLKNHNKEITKDFWSPFMGMKI